MAVYRGMDIGTAKPTPAVRAEVPYHLVDLVDPDEEFTVTRFQAAARTALDGIASRGDGALLVGGTGLYLRAVTDDLSFPGRYPDGGGRPGRRARPDRDRRERRAPGRLCRAARPAGGPGPGGRRRGSNPATSAAWSGPSR